MSEPNVPLTFVACIGCGSMTDIHAPTCPECDTPRPQRVDPIEPFDALRRGQAIRCHQCGDEEAGPWLVRDGRVWCEPCDDRRAA